MSRKCIVNFIFVFCIFPAAKGQISGKVFDNKTDVPIEYANILLKKDSKILEGTISKIDGSFLLPDVGNGKFSLKISFLGYETLETQNFNIQKNTPLDLGVIYLQNFVVGLVLLFDGMGLLYWRSLCRIRKNG